MKTLTILDFNLWHGLNPKGLLKFQAYETLSVREARMQGFIMQARRLDADIIFLQEINPAPKSTRALARMLNMDSVVQVDNAGVKIGPVGLPVNFQSGLAILARKGLGLRKVGGRKLSGPFGICSEAFSFQFGEFRYVLAAEVILDGQPVLLMNVHLHHGHEMTPRYMEVIEEQVSRGAIAPARAETLKAIARAASDRRRTEISGAMSLASELGYEDLPVIFAGDFNASPNAPEMVWLTSTLGFQSVTEDNDPEKLQFTWDTKRNAQTQRIEDFQPANEFEAFTLEYCMEAVLSESRRLDYILTRNTDDFLNTEGAGLFGDEPYEGAMISDHFGIWARFRIMEGVRKGGKR